MHDQWHGIRVVRTWIYATASKAFLPRLLNYFSFVISSIFLGAARTGRQDVVVVESPPLFLGLSGLAIGMLKRARVVFNVSDLWPDSAVALGVISNRALIRLSYGLEQFIYRHSDLITGQTRGIVAGIRTRSGSTPVHMLTNGVAMESFQPEHNVGVGLREELGLTGRLVVGYAGLHGLAQGLDTFIDSAKLLASHSDIAFVLVGDGVEKPRLKATAAGMGLKNVFFCDIRPKEEMPGILGSFDVALVPLKRLDLFRGALPSKMFEAMAAAVPIIVTIDGEARALVEAAEAGIYAEPENPEALAEAILDLAHNPLRRRELGENGGCFVLLHFNRQVIADQFEQLLFALCPCEPAAKATQLEVEP